MTTDTNGNKRIICASDFHIGYEYANYPAITQFFEMVQAESPDSLYLLGDIFDLWRCPINLIRTQEPMKSCLKELLKTAETVPTRIVWGNHDYKLSGQVPLKVTDEFVSDNILYCHGWRMDVEQCLGYPMFSWLVKEFPYLYQKFFKTPFEIQKAGGVDVNPEIHKIAEAYAQRKGYNYIIMGHTHAPYAGRYVFDCGDMVDDCTYATIEDGRPRLRRM